MVYSKLSSNCLVMKTVKGRQKPDCFILTLLQKNKTKQNERNTLKHFSKSLFLWRKQKNPLPDYNGWSLPEIFEEFSVLPT